MHWAGLDERVNADRTFVRFARLSSFKMLITSGRDDRLIHVVQGRMARPARGPFVMPQCDFALSGAEQVWKRFSRRDCAPQDQDIFAFFRRKELHLTGDTRAFYAHLLPVKLLLSHLGDGE